MISIKVIRGHILHKYILHSSCGHKNCFFHYSMYQIFLNTYVHSVNVEECRFSPRTILLEVIWGHTHAKILIINPPWMICIERLYSGRMWRAPLRNQSPLRMLLISSRIMCVKIHKLHSINISSRKVMVWIDGYGRNVNETYSFNVAPAANGR